MATVNGNGLSNGHSANGQMTNGHRSHNGYCNGSSSSTMPNRKRKVCVIGGGAAGLCAARHLSCFPHLFEFIVLEKCTNIGGTWNYTDKTGRDERGLPIHSSMYKNLRTNLPLQVMEYPDFPSNYEKSSFVHHSIVLEYLQEYADHFDIRKYIKLNHSVSWVERLEIENDGKSSWGISDDDDASSTSSNESTGQSSSGGIYDTNDRWAVTYTDWNTQTTHREIFDVVLVCNGRYAKPSMPTEAEMKGIDSFPGKLLHTHDYRIPAPFKDQRVVVLGAGPSGIDIATELGDHAKQVYLVHSLDTKFLDLPERVTEKRTGIQEIKGKDVYLKDGTVAQDIDTIIFATGYNYDFDFLAKNCDITVSPKGRVIGVYQHFINYNHPTMAVWAIPMRVLPLPLYHLQVQFYVKMLTGTLKLPSRDEMKAHAEADFKKRLEDGIPERHAHKMLGNRIWEYEDELASMIGASGTRQVLRKIYNYIHGVRKERSVGYKDLQFQVVNEQEYIVKYPDGQKLLLC